METSGGKADAFVGQSLRDGKLLISHLSHFCARSPLFFIQDFAFAQRGRFNSETGTSPLRNFFWCADDDFLVYAETEIGQGLVDGTRSLPRRLAGCLNDDKQIDVAVGAMR